MVPHPDGCVIDSGLSKVVLPLNAQLLFWRKSHSRDSQSPLDCTAATRDGAGTINQKELSKHCSAAAREAGSDASDNESRRDADIEAELLTRLSIFPAAAANCAATLSP